ncbi:MAG: SDR family NAD(P)-dependent oxidoreductase [Succinivibrionaceae bacterium]
MNKKLTTCKDIAVIGIALRFPNGINSLDDLWKLLSCGESAISEIPTNRWPTDLYQDSIKSILGRSVTFKAGVLENIKDFDASFFGISPKEAEWLDPQQRLLLEVTHECLEDAGIKVSEFKGANCGVYTGISSLDYGLQAPKDLPSISAYTMTGNTLSIASNRISYVFDLHGPSVSMDTACSSSLVSLHYACQAIRTEEVSCALVAGVHLLQDPYSFVGFSKASMLSPTGTCHPFADDANGYVRSEGVAVLLLKSLEDAIKDNNKIYAVIKASGVNTDGSRKNGLTIPSDIAQKELMEKVLFQSGLKASDIDYVEAHGTGTPVGDPIEAKSISSVYAVDRQNNQVLPISSAKGYLGHMEPMSGLASFIKAVLSLNHGYIPPIPFDYVPNKNIDFNKLKIQCTPNGLNICSKDIRTAGVNSFGFGGANAHVIVQNYSPKVESTIFEKEQNTAISNLDDKESSYSLFVSAKSKNALKKLCLKHIETLNSLQNFGTEDFLLRAYTYKTFIARDIYPCRVVFSASNKESFITEIRNFIENKVSYGADNNNLGGFTYVESHIDYKKIAFVFNGNGSQYIGMGVNLYKESSVFAEFMDILSEKIDRYLDFSIKNLLSDDNNTQNSVVVDIIQNTKIAQPLIFAIQLGLCKLLQIHGITPKAVIGHSMGEIAAAYISGKLTLDEAIKVICIRSMLQDTTRGQGKMAAVSVSKNEFNNICCELNITDVCVAAINSVDNITISGNTSSLNTLEKFFVNKKIFFKLLDVDYPFHSSYMDVIKDSVLNELHDISTNDKENEEKSSVISFYSSVIGTKCEKDFLLNNVYWWRNIRDEVNFYSGVKSLLEDGYDYLIEIGTNAILQRYLRDIAKEVTNKNLEKGNSLVINPKISSTLLPNNDSLSRMTKVIMESHLLCSNLDKSCFFGDVNNFNHSNLLNKNLLEALELPHYAWEKQHYEYKNSTEKVVEHFRESPLLGWKISSSEYIWENVLEPSKNQLLRDHIVDGQYVVAAADYIEIVLEALKSMLGNSAIENLCQWFNIEYLDIINPITMDNKECYKSVRVKILSNTQDFEILSKDYLSNDDWLLNIKGRLYSVTTSNSLVDNKNSKFIDSSSNSFVYSLDSCEIYDLTKKLGLTYGKNFRQLTKVVVNESEKMLKVCLVSNNECSSEYVIHPGVIDAGFQGLLASIIGNSRETTTNSTLSTYLPVKFGNVSIKSNISNSKITYIIGKLLKISSRSLLAEFSIFNADNECVGFLQDCRFNVLPRANNMNEQNISLWHYEQQALRHNLISTIDDKEFTPKKIAEFLSKLSLPEIFVKRRKIWFETVLPLIENAVLYYCLESLKIALSSVDNFTLSEQTKDSLHPLVLYIIDLLVDHNLIAINNNNQINFISESEESSGDEILRYAYENCPEAIYEILPIYRLGNKLPIVVSELIQNEFSSTENTKNTKNTTINTKINDYSTIYAGNAMKYKGIYKALLEFIVLLKRFVSNNKHILRVLELGNKNLIQTIVNKEFNGNLSSFEIVSLEVFDFDSRNLSIKEEKLNQIKNSLEQSGHNAFDLIVIDEQLCYVKDYDQALLNIYNLLSNKGLLIVIERNSDWSANILNGLDKSWWLEDKTSILKPSSYWESLLKSSYFNDTAIYTEPTSAGLQTGSYLIFAQKDLSCSNNQTIKNIEINNQIYTNNENILFIVSTNNQNFEEKNSDKCVVKELIINKLLDKVNSAVSASVIYEKIESIELDIDIKAYLLKTTFNKVVYVVSCIDELKTPNVLQQLAKLANNLYEINSSCRDISLSVITFNANEDSTSSAIRGEIRVISNELKNININSINIEIDSITSVDNFQKVVDFKVSSIWNELIASCGLDEITIELSNERNSLDLFNRTVIKKGFSDLTSFYKESLLNNNILGKAYYLDFSAPGRLKNLCWIEKEIPKAETLASNEVLVDVKVTGLNFRDIMMTMGLVPEDALEKGFSGPFLGFEFSGVISAIGSNVSDFAIGDRVLGFGSCCFSNKVVVKDYSISRIPKKWSFESAATVPIVFFTAWYALSTLANMKKGESILIHGAAGGVGIAAIQIAKYLGLEIYATAGSESKHDFLRMLGVEHIYNSRELDFRTELLRDTNGQGVDAVLNCLSGEAMRESLGLLKPFGRFMELGKRDFVENTSLGLRYFKENISYFAIDVDQLFKFNPIKAKEIFNQVIDLFKKEVFIPLPYISFSNNDIVNAFKYMQQGNQTGKVVVTIDELKSSIVTNINNIKNNVISSKDIWLITGGTRGFGWATAKYLLEQKKVKQVILVSRSGITDESVIKESRQYLVNKESNECSNTDRIIVKRCDVSDKNALEYLWQDLLSNNIQVTGIVHAAGVFADCLLKDITVEHYQKVWNSKYIGAKNLHELSKKSSTVKNFVVYSSISVAIGNIGQANYVATNSALEALVNKRIQEGYNACCIEWGPISDVGYLQDKGQVKKSLELAIGTEALNSAEALSLLPEAIIRGGTQIIANLNWLSISESIGKVPSRIYALVQDSKNQNQFISTNNLLLAIKDKTKSEAVNIISNILVSEIADTMGFTTEQINKEQNLQDMGLDSLMAMDLIVSIEKQTGIKLSVMAFQDNPNVNKLSLKIYEKMVGSDEGFAEATEVSSDENNSNSVIKQVLATHVESEDLQDFLVNKEVKSND